MGLTSKPCPGCGEDGGLDYFGKKPKKFRETGKVCRHCQQKLDDYDVLLRDLQPDDSSTDKVFLHASNVLGYFDSRRGEGRLHLHPHRTQEALRALLNAIEKPDYIEGDDRRDRVDKRMQVAADHDEKAGNRDGWRYPVVLSEKVGQVITDLIAALRYDFQATADRSFDNGNNLLSAMTEGRLTVDQINEAQRGEK